MRKFLHGTCTSAPLTNPVWRMAAILNFREMLISPRCICSSGMLDWLLWWQQRGSPASDWLSLVLYEYVGEEDLEVKHQAGNPSYASIRHTLCQFWCMGARLGPPQSTCSLDSRLDALDTWALRVIVGHAYSTPNPFWRVLTESAATTWAGSLFLYVPLAMSSAPYV